MAGINQYELSKALGSKMRPTGPVQFGTFGLLSAASEGVKSLDATRSEDDAVEKFGYEQDRVIVRAFEDVRDGASTDAILWDRELLGQFSARCLELGIDAPSKLLNRRLINVRKNRARYAKKGIVLSPTTRKEIHPGIDPEDAPVIEFALVRIRYRHGASIDDILLDPRLCEEYETLALEIAPSLPTEDIRRAALSIRKSRFIKKKKQAEIKSLQLEVLQSALSAPIRLAALDPHKVPSQPGLVEVDENDKRLYVAAIGDTQSMAVRFAGANAFNIVKSVFWSPDPNEITLRFVAGAKLDGVSMRNWECRLIADFQPLFNWPIHRGQGMAA